MKNHLLKRVLSWMIVFAMVLGFVPAVQASDGLTWTKTDRAVSIDRSDRLVETETAEPAHEDADIVRVSIVLEGASTIGAGYSTMGIAGNAEAMAHNTNLQAVQTRMEKTISAQALDGKALDVVWNMTLIGNIISAWVPYGKIDAIRAVPGVKTVALEAQYQPCVAETVETVQPNAYTSSAMTGTNALWAGGYTGAGSKIAVIDTGTDTDHQSFDNGAYLHALRENAAKKGMSYVDYTASLNLMDISTIAAVLPNLNLYELNPELTAQELFLSQKLPFAYNYVDNNQNVVHDYDYQSEHGSHVAGISAANRYIPEGSSYAAAADAVLMQGVAPDAQIITMKVFGEESPFDSDYMAAMEDAILLGCDAVNLSLGTTMPGAPCSDVYSGLLEMMQSTDTVVVIAAGNQGSWADMSMFGYLYSDDVSMNTVGSPGSYGSALTVASVENDGTVGFYFEANGVKSFYNEILGYGNTLFAGLDTSLNLDGTSYDYVLLEGLGYEEEYAGIDVSGKVVLVSRGTLNFAVKANTALARGAAAVVIYNNQPGLNNMDLTGLGYAAPVVSISQEDGMAIKAASQERAIPEGGSYYTGTMTVLGKQGATTFGSEYYTMSSFSSRGVPSDLSLKPEITAPGGAIYSVYGSTPSGGGSDQYETMSGTSMAAPQVSGMVALLAQYIREKGLEETTGLSARHLAQSLLMSTAQPLFEEESGGNYYSLMHQGAGLARVDLAASAESYVLVAGQDDAKVKAELGDDPERTGVYEFTFTITNIDGTERVYALSADAFRQDVFEYIEDSDVWLLDTWTTGLDAVAAFTCEGGEATVTFEGVDCDLNGDGVTDSADADYLLEYVVGNVSELKADGDLSGDGVVNSYDAHLLLAGLRSSTCVTVPANGTVTVHATLTLSAMDKAMIEAENPNGAYVQAFVYATAVADAEGDAGTTHSIPVLAFYGNWTDPTMFDRGTLVEHVYLAYDHGPYLYYAIGPYGNALSIDYGDGNEYYYGGNPILDDTSYLPERNAMNSEDASRLVEQDFTLIRGAGDGRMTITNAETGEVYFQKQLGELYPAFFNSSYGTWENTIQYVNLNWSGTDASGKPLAEGTQVDVTLTAVPYYYRNADGTYDFDGLGDGASMTTRITIDNTAPEASAIEVDPETGTRMTVTARDNEYVAAVALLNAGGTKMLAVASPNQTEKNAQVSVELDLSGVYGRNFLVAVYDYARNVTVYEIELELKGPERSYFTAIDYNTNTYVTLDAAGNTTSLADLDIPTMARAAEYVDGYVFTITSDAMLCVAKDADLSYTRLIGPLDPNNEWLVDAFADMAYNYADGQMYTLFYSGLNDSYLPYLATIDLTDASLNVLCEMPVDVHTLAIDGEGNCYSNTYAYPYLYTYTIDQAVSGQTTYVGSMSYYGCQAPCSMAWDHNTDELYFAFPNTLLKVDPATAEPTVLGYHTNQIIGLYIRSGEPTDRFEATDVVDRVDLNFTETRVLKDASLTLEASVWPWNASDRSVTWISSDESVATVDANGVVTGVSVGTCVVTAASSLDPTVSASCTIEVFQKDKLLNAIVWDEEGEIWWSRFSTSTLPAYTPMIPKSIGKDFASATVGQDGNIYAATLNKNTMKSELYSVDPVTYEHTLIGASTDGYVDLAPAPGAPGNSLMAVYGGNVMHVDATTGDYYNWYYMFSYNLVGMAYIGTQEYKVGAWDTMIDWYFIIDRIGYVYLMGFLEQDGAYYYIEHDTLAPGGIYTKLDFEMDTPYFGSAYFDGEFLYYSAYKESRNNVTLMAIDVAGGSKACYTLGTFDDGVWPVAGLMERGTLGGNVDILNTDGAVLLSQPIPGDQELTVAKYDPDPGTLHTTSGTLTAVSGDVLPMSDAGVKDGKVYVNVTLPAEATNGRMSVTFNPNELELTGVDGLTEAFAFAVNEVSVNDTSVELAFASAGMMPEDQTVVRLAFEPKAEGLVSVTIHTHELNDTDYWTSEDLTLELGHDCPSARFVDVSEDQWFHEAVDYVVEKGYMNGMDATHFGPGLTMNRAQFVTVLYRMEGEPAVNNTGVFTDVPDGQFYTEAAYWALENGITTGATATTFNPGGELTRTELVAFMYRYAKYKGYDTSATADLGNYADGGQVLPFAVDAWSWALTHGIVTGMTEKILAPMNLTNRAQAATIFQRLDNTFAN